MDTFVKYHKGELVEKGLHVWNSLQGRVAIQVSKFFSFYTHRQAWWQFSDWPGKHALSRSGLSNVSDFELWPSLSPSPPKPGQMRFVLCVSLGSTSCPTLSVHAGAVCSSSVLTISAFSSKVPIFIVGAVVQLPSRIQLLVALWTAAH